MFNVFVDHPVTRLNVETFNFDRAYDASAVANLMADRGFRVDTDLWSDCVPDAMVSPVVYERCDLGRVALMGSDV